MTPKDGASFNELFSAGRSQLGDARWRGLDPQV